MAGDLRLCRGACLPYHPGNGGPSRPRLPASDTSRHANRVGVPANLLMVEPAGHGFKAVCGRRGPSRPEIIRRIADDFDPTLR